tara:strand:- start:1279 stop:2097 length:819 start_codon:yes stop_codon:yes gene_type:complete
MKHLHCINQSFSHGLGSNDKVKPNFTWLHNQLPSNKDEPVVVIDSLLTSVMNMSEQYKMYSWLCESSAIISDTVQFIKDNLELVMSHYKKIFTCDYSLVSLHDRIEFCPPGSNMPWVTDEPKDKTNLVSIISSGKNTTDGHKLRNKCVEYCLNNPGFDVYGRAFNPIERKDEALLPYMFSIVYENCCCDKYYTEKITDCFASKTIPIYWGTNLIKEDFNEDGIIFVDNLPKTILSAELYHSKIDSVNENYDRVKKLEAADDLVYEKIMGEKP